MSADRYGQFYFGVETPTHLMNVYADEVEVVGGALVFRRKVGDASQMSPNLILAPGAWSVCFAAHLLDGSMIAVEHRRERAQAP